jgi:hypothetical protein
MTPQQCIGNCSQLTGRRLLCILHGVPACNLTHICTPNMRHASQVPPKSCSYVIG